MESGRRLFVRVTLLTVMFVAVSGQLPTIDPDYPVYYVVVSEPLNMTCTMQNTDKLEWYIGSSKATDADIGFRQSTRIDYPNGVRTMTVTITKATITAADSATFRCQATATQYRTIPVHVIPVTVTNADYNEMMGSAILGCNLSVDPSKYNMHWEFKNEKLVDNNKYTIYGGNNTLVISDPDHTDSGEYFCVYNFTENQQVIRVAAKFRG